jgi:Thiamine pyrophosphate enzyme, central domain
VPQLVVDVPASLEGVLEEEMAPSGRSMSSIVVTALARYLESPSIPSFRSRPPAHSSLASTIARNLPVVGTFQAAGAVGALLFDNFGGRVGQIANQPADGLLNAADLVVTVGYDPVEYWPPEWNANTKRKIIHIDVLPAQLENCYQPYVELTGDIAQTLDALTPQISRSAKSALSASMLEAIVAERNRLTEESATRGGTPIHPLRLLHELKQFLGSDVTVCLDMGSFHPWIARHLYSFRPRHVLITNGNRPLASHCHGASLEPSCGRRKRSCPSPAMAVSSIPRWSSRPRSGSRPTSSTLCGSTVPTTWWRHRRS